MPSFEIARYRYQDRITVLGYVEDALHAADAPLKDPSGSVTIIVRVTPPDMDVLGMGDDCGEEYAISVDRSIACGHPDARAHEKAVLDGQRHTEMPSL